MNRGNNNNIARGRGNTGRGRGRGARGQAPVGQQPAPVPNGFNLARGRGGRGGRGRGRGGAAQAAPHAPHHAAPAVQPAAPAAGAPAPAGGPAVNPPGAVQPPPPAEDTAVINLSVENVVKRAQAGFRIRVPEALAKKAELFGAQVEVIGRADGTPPNPHELLAQARRYATFLALCELVRNGHRIIDNMFGATRDDGLLAYLNGVFVRYGYPPNYVVLRQVHGVVVPLDYGRRPEVPIVGVEPATAALFMDVYCYGDAQRPLEINPDWISSLQYEEIIWVGHLFNGFYGSVATAAWIEEDSGLIRWSPDDVNPAYPPHLPARAMHTCGANGRMSWKIAKVVTYKHEVAYNLVRFTRSQLVSTPQVLHTPKTKARLIEVPDYQRLVFDGFFTRHLNTPFVWIVHSGVLNPVLPRRQVRVNLGHFQAACNFMLPRHRNSFTYSALLQRIVAMLAADSDWSEVNERFPDFFQDYAEDLALAVFIDKALVRSVTLSAVRNSFSGYFREYSTDVKHINEPPTGPGFLSTSKWIIGPALTLIGWWATSRYFAARTSRKVVNATGAFLGPVVRTATTQASNLMSTVVDVNVDIFETDHLDRWLNRGIRYGLEVARRVWDWLPALPRPTLPDLPLVVRPGMIMRLGAFLNLVQQYGYEAPSHEFTDQDWAELRPKLNGLIVGATVVAPVVEEGLKRVVPTPFSPIVSAVIAYGDAASVDSENFTVTWIGQFLKHYLMGRLPIKFAIPIHALYNLYTLTMNGLALEYALEAAAEKDPTLVAPALTAFKALSMMQSRWFLLATPIVAYAIHKTFLTPREPVEEVCTMLELVDTVNKTGQQHPSVPGRTDWVSVARYPISQCFFPSQEVADYPLPKFDPEIHFSVHFEPLKQEATDGFYRWFVHPVALFRPNNSTNNMLSMCQFRLLRDVPERADDEWYFLALMAPLAISSALVFGHQGYFVSYDAFCMLASRGCRSWKNHPKKPKTKTDEYILGQLLFLIERMEDVMRNTIETQPQKSAAQIFAYHARTLYAKPWLECFPIISMSDELWFQWLDHVDSGNKKLYIAAREKLLTTPLTVDDNCIKNVQVNIKRDEVLIKQELFGPDGEVIEKGPIPRPIHAVDKLVTVSVGPYVYEATNRVKEILFCYQVGEIYDRPMFWTWGAGLTDMQLSLWWDHAVHNDGWHLIVAGDDMLLIHTSIRTCSHTPPALMFFEGDLSQCDHTSRIGSLFAEYAFLHFLGVPLSVIALILANARAKLVIGNRNHTSDSVEIHREYERNTGGTDTTFGNSVTSLLAATYALLSSKMNREHRCLSGACPYAANRETDNVSKEFVDSYLRLGLSLKLRVTSCQMLDDLGTTCPLPTFLKGTWYPCRPFHAEQRELWRAWGPLPSRLLKMCKTLNDPRVTMRRPGEPEISLREGLFRFHQALCYGLKDFMWPPGMKKWLVRTAPQVEPVMPKRKQLTDSYILQTQEGSFRYAAADHYCYAELALHYKVPLDVVADFFDVHLQQVEFLTFSEHPFWFALAQDYA